MKPISTYTELEDKDKLILEAILLKNGQKEEDVKRVFDGAYLTNYISYQAFARARVDGFKKICYVFSVLCECYKKEGSEDSL